jgi:hypothetical protein
MRRSVSRWIVVSAAAAGLALTFVLVALADKEPVHLTAADQAFAHAAVLQKADLGTVGTWTGGAVKPDLNSSFPCGSTFQPKQSDLLLTGAAETVFKQPGISLDSEAQVLQTPQMVKLDWQRTVLAPQVLPCLRIGFAKTATASTRFVSIRRIAFPRVAQYTYALRALFDVKSAATGTTVRVFVDVVLVGRGRTELSLTTTAPFVADASVRAAEARLALIMAARARA